VNENVNSVARRLFVESVGRTCSFAFSDKGSADAARAALVAREDEASLYDVTSSSVRGVRHGEASSREASAADMAASDDVDYRRGEYEAWFFVVNAQEPQGETLVDRWCREHYPSAYLGYEQA
jgi:hypothetical protein